jgi:N-acetylglucosamine-6-phosphate deacetylase
MAITLIDCGTLVLPARAQRDMRLLIEDGVIREIAAHIDAPQDAIVIDAREYIVLSGFIDIHVHGAMDVDTMDATPEALHTLAAFFAAHGVTSFLPTTMTAPRQQIDAAVENVRRAILNPHPNAPPEGAGAHILGTHIEGPYLNPKQCGAQPVEFMRLPDPDEYCRWFDSGTVKLITVAPEMPACMRLIEEAHRANVFVALGHTDATFAQAEAAFAAGANQATHTYNAMRGLHHREPGTLGAVMFNPKVFAQLICDNVHVHPAAMAVLYRCKGPDKLAVITDAMEATGLGDGDYKLGAHEVLVREGVARTKGGALAGSTLTMDAAFRNIIAATGCTLSEASRMCSLTPAASIGVADRKGKLAPGCDADIVILDHKLNVVRTIVGAT